MKVSLPARFPQRSLATCPLVPAENPAGLTIPLSRRRVIVARPVLWVPPALPVPLVLPAPSVPPANKETEARR